MLLLTSCQQPRVIDDLRIVQALGYDYVSPKLVRGTASIPIFQKGGGGGPESAKSDTYSVLANRGRQLQDKLNAQEQHPIVFGKIMVVLFNTTLAKTGIYEYIDILNRNPEIGFMLNPVIVDGSTQTLLNTQYRSSPLVSMYLSDLLKQNAKENLPDTNLQTFLFGYYSYGADPFLPLLKQEGDHVKIKGIALFNDDRYVGYLPFRDAFVFKMLFQSFSSGSYAAPWSKKHTVSIENIGSKVEYHVKNTNGDPNQPEIYINVDQVGYLRTSSVGIGPREAVTTLQKKMEADLKNRGQRVLKILQRKSIDPLQIGDRVRSYTRSWSPRKWDNYYPYARIKLNVSVKIIQTGIIE